MNEAAQQAPKQCGSGLLTEATDPNRATLVAFCEGAEAARASSHQERFQPDAADCTMALSA